jgi:hypothetical protein
LDAFVTAINPAGTAILFSTYFGGHGDDSAEGLALGPGRSVYIVGQSSSSDLHGASSSPIQPHLAGGVQGDAFVAKIATVSCAMEPRSCVLAVEPPEPGKIAPRQ